MIMNTVVVAALVLLLSLLITTTARAGTKTKRCYEVYDKKNNSCTKPLGKGSLTIEDCCSKYGGAAYGSKKRGRGKCTPCDKKAGTEGAKKRCYKVYDKKNNSCTKPLGKGRHTIEDCCSKHGGAAYGSKKRGRGKKCTPCDKKAGTEASNWGGWGQWSGCKVQCGKGIMRRRRKCLDINAECPGRKVQKKSCVNLKVPNCPVHGGWSDFGNWTKCSTTCGTGFQLRFRSCTNPKPQYGGKKCIGVREEKRECKDLPHCPIHGNWGSWGRWSSCSVTCDVGERQRRRECDNPKPKYNGRICDPKDGVDTESCDAFKNCDASGSGSGIASGSGSGDSGSVSGDDDDDDGDGSSGKKPGSGDGIVVHAIMADRSNGTKNGSDFDFDGDKKKPSRKT